MNERTLMEYLLVESRCLLKRNSDYGQEALPQLVREMSTNIKCILFHFPFNSSKSNCLKQLSVLMFV